MPQAKGANARTIIQEETTYKVSPAADAMLVYFSQNTLKLNRGRESSDILRGNRNPTKSARGDDDISGAIVTELQAYIGLLLKAALGSVVTTGAGPYTHTIKIGSALPSLLIEKGFPDISQYFLYNGCKVNRVSMDVTRKGLQRVTFDFLGAKETTGSTSFDDTATDLGKVSFDGLTVASIQEGGSDIARVVSINGLTVENDLDPDGYNLGGGGERDDLSEGLVKVSGTLVARFDDLILYNKAIGDTESSLLIKWQVGDGSGSAGNESLELRIPELVYAANAPVIQGPRGVLAELPFEAFYDNSSEATSIQAILKNAQATI